MSTPHPETNSSSTPESKPKQIAEPIYTHSVSWIWFVAGLVGVLGLGGAVAGIYLWQTTHMAGNILEVADAMVKQSDDYKAQMEQTTDPAVKKDLMSESIKERSQAANLLDQYRRANPEKPVAEVLTKLYAILESLYKDHGEGTTPQGLQRGRQLSELAVELIRNVSEGDSLVYRKRLLELDWDRQYLTGIIDRGKQLLEAARKAGDAENYDAMRYIAMALFDHLPVEPYNPRDLSLPTGTFDEALDTLLGKLNALKPEDIEIAKRYAEFVVSMDHPDEVRRRRIAECVSEQLDKKDAPTRLAEAKRIIDGMVQRNKDNPDAYLARYHFNTFLTSAKIAPASDTLDLANPDLATVLKLAPGNAEGLILSSLDALRQAEIAKNNDEPDRVADWQNKAEEFLHQTVKANPADPFGYQYLGDFLLFVRQQPMDAIRAWEKGLENSHRSGDEELIGRLALVLLGQKMVDEVRAKLTTLDRALPEIRITRSSSDYERIRQMRELLGAQLSNTEANVAASKIEEARRANNTREVKRLFNVVQTKKGEAMQNYEKVLQNWGKDPNHYIFLNEKKSVYNILLPESLLQLGDLKMDWGIWDKAVEYFERALPIPSADVQKKALFKLSLARQQGGQLDAAARTLEQLSRRSPNDMNIRYMYASLLFRSQIASNSADPKVLDDVEKEFKTLEQRRDELTQPWAVDIRLIHLGIARANLSNSADTIVEAMKEAARKFRALEKQTFPPDKDGNVKNYIDDPAFVAEMVGIYSSLTELNDFNRLLKILRAFPEGEDAYFVARINDCLRREDKPGAVAIIEEAGSSTRLTAAKREQFVSLLQSLDEAPDAKQALDSTYIQLKTTFDEEPETLKPQAFFILAAMSLDRGDMEQAEKIKERLAILEGSDGRMTRYIGVRLMLGEKDPDYARMREIQEDIAGKEPKWDMGHLLRAMIEEQYLISNPEDMEARKKLVESYQAATDAGNMRAEVWQRLVSLLDMIGEPEKARTAIRDAARRGIMLETRTGQLPQPYGRMYSQVQDAIANEDAIEADTVARQCLRLAEVRNEKPELVFTLNLVLGKVFLDSQMYASAIRHLSETAKRGGTYIYPLAVCMAKAGNVDDGFTLLLNEIDLVPSDMPKLLPTVLVLLDQVQPSEEVYERIDRLMNRIERGERLTLRGTLAASDEKDHFVPLGTRWTPSRKIQSLVIRFPEQTENFDPSGLQFVSPEELGEEE